MLKASVTLPHFSSGDWNPTQDPRWLQAQTPSTTPSASGSLPLWRQSAEAENPKQQQRGGTPAWGKCRQLETDIADLAFPSVEALDYSLSPLFAADSGLPIVEISNLELRLKDATTGLRHLFNNLSLLVAESAPKIRGLEAIVLQCKSICSTVTQGNIECFSILSSFRMKQLQQPDSSATSNSIATDAEKDTRRRGRALDDATLEKLDALLKILESGGSTSAELGNSTFPADPSKGKKGRALPKPMSPSYFVETKEEPTRVSQKAKTETPPSAVASATPIVSPVTSEEEIAVSSRPDWRRCQSDVSPLSSISSLSPSSGTEVEEVSKNNPDTPHTPSPLSSKPMPRTPQEALRGYGFLRTRDSKGAALLTPRSRIRKRRIQRR